MKVTGDTAAEGRAAFQRGSWGSAFDQLSSADREAGLAPEDLERLATAAYMTGRDADSDDAWLRAHQGQLRLSDTARAARCAFWQATCLLFRGDVAPALGWIARGRRLLEGGRQERVEHGWLLTLTALPMVFEGDPDPALPSLTDAIEIAERFGDEDLVVLARLGLGQAMILQQRTTEVLSLLDEIMVSVLAEQISPVMVGIAYCNAIDLCQQVFELRRAREWTDALSRWCDSQPDLVPYRGNCLVHRCEVFQLHGAWRDALDAAQARASGCRGPRTGTRSDRRTTSSVRFTGYAASSRRRKRPTARPAMPAEIPSPACRCCGWRWGGRPSPP